MVDERYNVLIVDDEQVICDLLVEELSESELKCYSVTDGKSALEKINNESFDLILLDIRLPGMSGIELLRELWLNHSNVPIIMITAVNDIDTAVEAMKLGAVDYIVKPFDLEKVNASVRTALENQTTNKSASQMDAIARGVEVKLDPFSAYSKVVTQKTVEIARQLGIPEDEINRWAVEKERLHTGKRK
jgi:DNA-binding response OmpR family regulator